MDLVNLTSGNAVLIGLTGYLVVFLGLVLLMVVIMILGRAMHKNTPAAATVAVESVPSVPKEKAPGTAGELKLYNTDPKDAAMAMAVVADELKTPLNELRFISIREVEK